MSFVDLYKCPRDGTTALDYCDTPKSGKVIVNHFVIIVLLVVLEAVMRAQSGE